MLEYNRLWTFTSTGAGAWEDAFHAREHNFIVETAAGSTATVVIEQRRSNGSVAVQLGTSMNLDASSGTSQQLTGAFYQVRARVTDMTSTGTVYVQGVGN